MKKSLIWLLPSLVLIAACRKDRIVLGGTDIQTFMTKQSVEVNPSGFAPLTANIILETTVNTKARIRVVGKNGPDSDVVNDFTEFSNSHVFPVLGLYGGRDNPVELTLFDEAGNNLGTDTFSIHTDSLIADLPRITIDVPPAQVQPEMTLVSYYGYATDKLPQRPFIFDDFGDVRWYLDYRTNPALSQLSMEDGVAPLANGNFYFGDLNSNAIYEIDMFGKILNTWPLASTGFSFHHEVLEKPDGNFLITVNKIGLTTVEDHVIELSRTTGDVVRPWDMRQSLQYGRTAWTTDTEDWMHLNAVAYDSLDDCILVSGRTQGVAKLDADNNVKWIMAPHRGWGIAGNGIDLNTKLLTPLDAQGNSITDPDVLDGATNHPDFEWNWYQHAPKILPDRSILLFDDGDNRNYDAGGIYSRAVRFKVDDEAMTIQQQWQYGKERGVQTFSSFVSEVDYHPNTGHIVFSSGAVNNDGDPHGKIVEIQENTSNVVFEATIVPPQTTGVTFHRSERVNLYR